VISQQFSDGFPGADSQLNNVFVHKEFVTVAEKKIPDALRVEF
jgi:hypothetical protein